MRPIAPYFSDTADAAAHCFDRETGAPIARDQLKSYADSLRAYHLSPESKFENADYHDVGPTTRRHVLAVGIRHIGKEANRWEEQHHLGIREECDVEYVADAQSGTTGANLLERAFGSDRKTARDSGISRTTLNRVKEGGNVSASIRTKLIAALAKQNSEIGELAELRNLAIAEIRKIGAVEFGRRLNFDPSNLSKSLAGRRGMSQRLKMAVKDYFDRN